MDLVINKQFPNYLLLTEATKLLQPAIGKPLVKLKTGLWDESFEKFRERMGVTEGDPLREVVHGGPIFLSFGDRSTYVFQSDDIADAVVVRVVPLDMDDEHFLETLSKEDSYLRDSMRIKLIVDLAPECHLRGQTVARVEIFKLPNNYFGRPTRYDKLCERALVLTMSSGESLLVSHRMDAKYRNGLALLHWEEVDPNFPKQDFTCVWTYP